MFFVYICLNIICKKDTLEIFMTELALTESFLLLLVMSQYLQIGAAAQVLQQVCSFPVAWRED